LKVPKGITVVPILRSNVQGILARQFVVAVQFGATRRVVRITGLARVARGVVGGGDLFDLFALVARGVVARGAPANPRAFFEFFTVNGAELVGPHVLRTGKLTHV
jgi:hypothetical protein